LCAWKASRGQGGRPAGLPTFPGGLLLPRTTTLRQAQQPSPAREAARGAARRHLTRTREVQVVMSAMCLDGVRDAATLYYIYSLLGPIRAADAPLPRTHTSIITDECACARGSASAAQTRLSALDVDVRDRTHMNVYMSTRPHATMHTLSRRLVTSDINVCMFARQAHAPIYTYPRWSSAARSSVRAAAGEIVVYVIHAYIHSVVSTRYMKYVDATLRDSAHPVSTTRVVRRRSVHVGASTVCY
jgi:hypothetical protein